MFLKLAFKSLLSRKGSVVLTLLAMTVSVFVLLAVEHVRFQAKDNFAKTVSGVDLIVGARTGSLNLLLYSVFHIGSPTNNISWDTYKTITQSSQVKWAVPISLGDSHKGYRVMGTTQDFFKHFSYGNQHKLSFSEGKAFAGVFDLVLGAAVAKKLGYSVNDKIILSHGLASTSFSLHDDKPFNVVGILKPTGTPVDQTVHVSLQGIEAIHMNWKQGIKQTNNPLSENEINQLNLQPKSITAFMLGLKSRMATFKVQRDINEMKTEPMLAILPGVALSELWQMMGVLENTLFFIAVLVFISALLGLSAMLLSSIKEREPEIKLLRAIGAPASFLFLLVQLEALFISFTSLVLGAAFLSVGIFITQGFLVAEFGLHISSNIFSKTAFYFCLGIIAASVVIALIPSIKAYSKAKL